MNTTTKDLFANMRRVFVGMSSVDAFVINAQQPNTRRVDNMKRLVTAIPTSNSFNADNVTHYAAWQFLLYYTSEDMNDHLDFIDELEEMLPIDVVSFYNQHRIPGWAPYSIVRFQTMSGFIRTFGDDQSQQQRPNRL